MNFKSTETGPATAKKNTATEKKDRSEESLTHAVSVLKSLSEWNKTKLLKGT